MDFLKLSSFCMIVDCGSMSKAAEVLYCSQPALSKQIVALEKEIGYPLFDRNGKKMTLNENGRLLYQFAKTLEQSYNRLKAQLYAQNHPYSHEIRLGATNLIGTYLLPPILSEFKKVYPDIPVNFAVDFFPNIMEMLAQDAIDFALIPEDAKTLQDPTYACQPFREEEMVLVVPADHPLAEREEVQPEELEPYPFLISQVKSASRAFILGRLEARGVQLHNMQNMYNAGTIKQAVVNGLGIAILSRYFIRNEEKNGTVKVVPIRGVDLTRKLFIAHRRNHVLTEEDLLFTQLFLHREPDFGKDDLT